MTPSASAAASDEAGRESLVGLGRGAKRTVALAGNPNTGKSTLFNALTGLRQKVANYPGITVDVHIGSFPTSGPWIELLDLPGIYSLAAHSPDERLALDVLLGRTGGGRPDAVLLVLDATNLERNLFVAGQILELGLPTVVALTMLDEAEKLGMRIDADRIRERLGVPLVEVVANHRRGIPQLKEALEEVFDQDAPQVPAAPLPRVRARAEAEAERLGGAVTHFDVERALIDQGGASEDRLEELAPRAMKDVRRLREELEEDVTLAEAEAVARYDWAAHILEGVVIQTDAAQRVGPIDRLLRNTVAGSLTFFALMAIMFQAVFAWAAPAMDAIDGAAGSLASWLQSQLPENLFTSFLTDGVIAGVGAVIVFLPQILVLFAFILVLEDSGYMARAAFLIDRLMRACGLSGQSFVPMLSSFACAVPGIMATRTIPSRRDRLATILAAPFMTCSARLPVYALLIAAVVPDRQVLPLVNLQGLVLLGLYLFGMAGGILTALLMKRTALRGPTPPFLLELPPLRRPSLQSVFVRLVERGRLFLVRAGTIIFTVSVVVWALATFPRSETVQQEYASQRAAVTQSLAGEALELRLADLEAQESAAMLEASALGRMGKAIEPIFRPLGWDWRISSAVLASFPAREVIVATLGTIYALGEVDETDQRLLERIRGATWADGSEIFTAPVAIGLMLFFALCLQCGATLAIIKRESGGWRWPIFAWCYMTALAYVSAFVAYRGLTALGL